jgi:hypothetical protein
MTSMSFVAFFNRITLYAYGFQRYGMMKTHFKTKKYVSAWIVLQGVKVFI